MSVELHPGSPYPLGATWDGKGVNFAIYSENATGIELCLVDAHASERRISLRERTAFVWHGYRAGDRSAALRVHVIHGGHEAIDFTLPEAGAGDPWELLIDTADTADAAAPRTFRPGERCRLEGRSLQLLRRGSPPRA